MAVHGPYKTKSNAKSASAKYRAKGYVATPYKTDKGWCISVTRK